MSLIRHRRTLRQRGIAAVELAIILPVLVLMLAFPLYLGRVYWHYTVLQHAAQDAARYLSKVPVSELSNPARAADVAEVAREIVRMELAELAPGAYPPDVIIACNNVNCLGYATPTTVRVSIQLLMEDIFFSGYTQVMIPLSVDVTFPYMGR